MVTLFECFLVQTGAIKTGFLAQFDIPAQRFIRRCGPDTVGIKALIEYQPLVVRSIIQKNFIPLNMHFAQAGIRLSPHRAHFRQDRSAGKLHRPGTETPESRVSGCAEAARLLHYSMLSRLFSQRFLHHPALQPAIYSPIHDGNGDAQQVDFGQCLPRFAPKPILADQPLPARRSAIFR